MKKYIAFDFDGTLVHFPIRFMFSETYRILKLLSLDPVSEDELSECFSDFDFFRFIRIEGRNEAWEEQFRDSYWAEFDWGKFPQPVPFKETPETLERLINLGYTLCIATARVVSPEGLESELEKCGLASYFSFIETRASHEDDWQDKSPQLLRLFKKTGANASDFTMVGDIPSDITSGRAVGVAYNIAVQSGGIKEEVLESSGPDVVLEHLGDLPNFLLGLDENT